MLEGWDSSSCQVGLEADILELDWLRILTRLFRRFKNQFKDKNTDLLFSQGISTFLNIQGKC